MPATEQPPCWRHRVRPATGGRLQVEPSLHFAPHADFQPLGSWPASESAWGIGVCTGSVPSFGSVMPASPATATRPPPRPGPPWPRPRGARHATLPRLAGRPALLCESGVSEKWCGVLTGPRCRCTIPAEAPNNIAVLRLADLEFLGAVHGPLPVCRALRGRGGVPGFLYSCVPVLG